MCKTLTRCIVMTHLSAEHQMAVKGIQVWAKIVRGAYMRWTTPEMTTVPHTA